MAEVGITIRLFHISDSKFWQAASLRKIHFTSHRDCRKRMHRHFAKKGKAEKNFMQLVAKRSETLFQGKAIQLQAWTGPQNSRTLRISEFLENRQVKVVRLSALCTSRLYPATHIPGTHFSQRLSRPNDHIVNGMIKSITPTGIEPTNFRLVAKCLNQKSYPVLCGLRLKGKKVKVKVVCGSYCTAALRHIVLLPE